MNRYLAAAVVLSLSFAALAKDANPDAAFFKKAAEAGLAEVAAGEDAQAKGSSATVKDFAAMMVKDHSAANAKLKAIATSKGVELPTEPSLIHKAKMKKMDMMKDASFDKDYVEAQITDHKETLDLLKKEIASGKDADGKAFANETLPTVQMHYDKINQIAASMGVKK